MSLGGDFEGWTLEALIRQLRLEGNDIPEGAEEDAVLAVAIAHFEGRPIPRPPRRKSRDSTRQRLQYVPSSQAEATVSRLRVQLGLNEDEDGNEEEKQDFDDAPLNGNRRSSQRRNSQKRNSQKRNSQREPLQGRIETRHSQRRRSQRRNSQRRSGGGMNQERDPRLAERIIHSDSLQGASIERTREYINRIHPRDEDFNQFQLCGSTTGRLCLPHSSCCDIFFEGTESDLLIVGVGVSLYFKWLKMLFWVYFLISILAIPQLVFNRIGAQERDFTLVSGIFLTSIGNLVDEQLFANITENGTSVVFIGDTNLDFKGSITIPGATCGGKACEFSRSQLAFVYLVTDIMITVLFLAATIYLRLMIPLEQPQATKEYRRIEQYSVELTHFPKEVGSERLKGFLEEHLSVKIHDVKLGKNNGALINLFLNRGALMNKLWDCVGMAESLIHKYKEDRKKSLTVRYGLEGAGVNDHIIRAKKARKDARKLTAVYDSIFIQYEALKEIRKDLDIGSQAVVAFVTFEDLHGYRRCLRALSSAGGRRICPKLSRRAAEQRLARTDSGFITESSSVVDNQFTVPTLKGKRLRASPAPPPGAIIWENLAYSVWSQRLRRTGTSLLALLIIGVSFAASYIAQAYRVETLGAVSADDCNATLITNLEATGPQTPEEVICFCGALPYTDAAVAVFDTGDVCHEFWVGIAPFFFFTIFATGIIALVNILLGFAARTLAGLEKHKSATSQELSIGSRLFIGYYFNVGFVLVIVNASITTFESVSTLSAGVIGNGQYEDFTSEWYSNVGTQLVATVVINSLAPHFLNLALYLYAIYKRRNVDAIVQSQLNAAYAGPDFIPSLRYAQLLTMVMVSMTYGAGMPILYPIGLGTFAFTYMVDKFLFLRYYRRPPEFGPSLTIFASYTMLFAPPIHLAFAIWMYSTPGIFLAADLGFFDRIFTNYPALILLMISLVILVLDSTIISVAVWLWGCLNKSSAIRLGLEDDEDFVNVTDAKQQGLFGNSILSTYNMLQNDKYMRAFGLDPAFADTHDDLADLIRLQEQRSEEEEAITVPTLPAELATLGEQELLTAHV